MKKTYTKWFTCVICASFLAYTIIQVYIFGVFHAELIKELAVSPFVYGQISSLYWYFLAFALLPVGILCDRYSVKKLLLFAASLSFIASFVLYLIPSLPTCIINRAICGIANAFAFIGGLRVIQEKYHSNPTLATGIFVSLGNLGGIIASGPYVYLQAIYSWQIILLINVLMAFFIILLIFFYLQETEESKIKKESSSSFFEDFKKTLIGMKIACSNINNWACGFYLGVLTIPDGVFAPLWGIVYLTQKYAISESHAGTVISSLILGIGMGCPLMGWLGDFWRNTKLLMLSTSILCATIFLYVAKTAMIPFFTLIILFWSIGMLISATVLAYTSVQENASKEQAGFSLALAAIIMNSFVGFSQYFVGWVLEKNWDGRLINGSPIYTTRNLDSALLLAPMAFFLSITLIYFIKGTKLVTVAKKLEFNKVK